MITAFIIAFFTLIGLIVLHEFGHFILAKRFGTKVEEFGIGYPPRLIGKKIGETIYSLNLLPFGAFVKIHGEEGGIEDYRSFSEKPIWQRALIVLAGVISFWIIAAILLSVVFGLGAPTAVTDQANHNLINPKVQITQVAKNSPAAKAGLKPLDTILEISNSKVLKTDKMKPVVKFIKAHKGQQVVLKIKRWDEIKQVSLVPRVSPPEDEGPMGVALTRTALKPYPAWQAVLKGPTACVTMTIGAVKGIAKLGAGLIQGKGMPPGARPMGPVGIFNFLNQAFSLGVSYFLYFVALISIFLAIFNILPIPALDGGKLMFLTIERVRGRPVSAKVEQKITGFFFILLISLMILVTIRFDIPRLM